MPASATTDSLHSKKNLVFVQIYRDVHGDQGWQPSLRLEYSEVNTQSILRKGVKGELGKKLEEELKTELRRELEEEFRGETTKKFGRELQEGFREETTKKLGRELEGELRELLTKKLKRKLRNKLKSKKKLEEEFEEELERRLEKKSLEKLKNNVEYYLSNPVYLGRRITAVVRIERDLEDSQTLSSLSRVGLPLKRVTKSISLDISRQWLENCAAHEECKESGYIPTRLIDISEFPKSNPRLCQGKNLPTGTRYLTLSHCWGKNLSLRLLESNISAMEKAIPFGDLPKTFQDAIKVVQNLGVRYIWIDALCIVQDSTEEWRRESGKMGMVYANSYCNISATASLDGSGGLWDSWRRKSAPLVRLNIRRPQDPLPERYYAYNPEMFNMEVNDAPLNRRAWVLQERLLSPRNLQFGAKQLFWECRRMTACEAFPQGLPVKMRDNDIKRKFATILKTTIQNQFSKSKATISEIHKYWGDLVQIYCNSNLTFSKDRLVAISGLASKFYPILQSLSMFENLSGQPEYLAGLWNHDPISQILWKVTRGRRQTVYTAPSWSWASIEGEFEFIFKPHYQGIQGSCKDLITIEDSWIQLLDHLEPFGQVDGGCLKIQGKLAKASYNKIGAVEQIELSSIRSIRDKSFYKDMLSVFWDAKASLGSSGITYLLPIRARSNDPEVLENIIRRMEGNNDPNFKREPQDLEGESDFKDGYVEGLLLRAVDSASSNVDGDVWAIPKQFRRVGRWETLAVEKLFEEVDFMDKKGEIADHLPSTKSDGHEARVYPRYTIEIV